MKEISRDLLDEIQRRVVEEFHPARLYLFGSHAWGVPTRDSDLDLLIVLEREEAPRIEYLRRAYGCVGDLPVPVEFVVQTLEEVDKFKDVKASLTRKILAKGRLLYG
jgi:predicted nucleotidyltransferase